MVWSVVRAEVRSSGAALAGLAAMVAVLTAFGAVAASGGRRAETALPRLYARSLPADAMVTVPAADPVAEAIASRPEVAAFTGFSIVMAFPLDDAGGIVGFEQGGMGTVLPANRQFAHTVDRPRVRAGRVADPGRVDEVTVSEPLAAVLGVAPGDRIEVVSLTPEQTSALFGGGDPGAPAGPTLSATVTGVVTYDFELGEGDVPANILTLTDAFRRVHGDRVGEISPALARYRLRPGADRDAFAEAARRAVAGREGAVVDLGQGVTASLQRANEFQALAYSLFAAVLVVALIAVAGPAAARQIEARARLGHLMQALGSTRRAAALALVAPVAGATGVGTAAGLVAAVLASPLTPTGEARRAEPSPGVDANVPLLAAVAAASVVGVTAIAWLGARRALRAGAGAGTAPAAGRGVPLAVAERAARLGLPVPVVVGLELLTEPERRRGAGSRAAMAGTVVAVAALTAALVVGAAMANLLGTKRLYGWAADALVETPDPQAAAGRIVDVPGVDAAAPAFVFTAAIGEGVTELMAIDPADASVFPTIVDGRAPAARNELALGGRTMRRLGIDLGDRVRVTAATEAEFVVVGQSVAIVTSSDQAGEGGAVLATGADRIGAERIEEAQGVLVSFDDGADHAAVAAAVERALEADVVLPVPPGDVANFDEVRSVPAVLAALLALLAAAVVVHGLLVGARRRATDLAVLRSVGFVRRQTAGVLAAQATGLALVATAAGLPAGLFLGRWVWLTVAGRMGVVGATPVPALALGAVVLGALLVANAAAAGPAWLAVRQKPAPVLRKE